MLKFRVTQFLEIFLASSILANLLSQLSQLLPIPATASLWFLVLASSTGLWVYWWYDSGKTTFSEISLIAVAMGVLLSTWL